jgi:hypothetical protein
VSEKKRIPQDLNYSELYGLGQNNPEFVKIREGIPERWESLQSHQLEQLKRLEDCYFLMQGATLTSLLVFQKDLQSYATLILGFLLVSVLLYFWYRAMIYIETNRHHSLYNRAYEKFIDNQTLLKDLWQADADALPKDEPLALIFLWSFIVYCAGLIIFFIALNQITLLLIFLSLIAWMLLSLKDYFLRIKGK